MPEEIQETLSEPGDVVVDFPRLVCYELNKLKENPSYTPTLSVKNYALDPSAPNGFHRVRPCLEEFVAANYPADRYDAFFHNEDESAIPWGPGWSNPNWVPQVSLEGLPAVLQVRSQVRRQGTRTQRATAPKRHRFKQYLFGDPSHRLIRSRILAVQTSRVLAGIDELIERERLGMLSVHLPNGDRLDLLALKAMEIKTYGLPLPAPMPNPPLDSIANDEPAGNPMPQYIDGSFPGDPAAERTLESMLKDKQTELREDSPPADLVNDPLEDPAATPDAVEDPIGDSSSSEGEVVSAPVTDDAQVPDTSSAVEAPEAPEPPAEAATASTTSAQATSAHKGKKGKR